MVGNQLRRRQRLDEQHLRKRQDIAAGAEHRLLIMATAVARLSPTSFASALASPRLTVLFFLLMAAGALWAAKGGADATVAVVTPLSLLVVNLLAAIVSMPRFRADLPLLLFHLALLLLVSLLVVARLTYFDGATVLTAGTAYGGHLLRNDRGPLHGDGPDALRFANEGFTEDFPARGHALSTYNRVRWWDQGGGTHLASIGDNRPLILDGYRIYPTVRRGFAPLFSWQPDVGEASFGTVELADTGVAGPGPTSELKLPGGIDAWIMIFLEDAPKYVPGTRLDDLGTAELAHHLILRMGDTRVELRPGTHLDLPGGRLHYVRLSSWMGYRIVKDPTEPWIVATVLVGIGSLLWFYAQRLLPKGSYIYRD
jgi:cytochrome c biogenesis protein